MKSHLVMKSTSDSEGGSWGRREGQALTKGQICLYICQGTAAADEEIKEASVGLLDNPNCKKLKQTLLERLSWEANPRQG